MIEIFSFTGWDFFTFLAFIQGTGKNNFRIIKDLNRGATPLLLRRGRSQKITNCSRVEMADALKVIAGPLIPNGGTWKFGISMIDKNVN